MEEYASHFRLFQCSICGKMFDTEDAQQEHERKCRRESQLLYGNQALDEQLAREGTLMSR
jgi:DNA-directed RNA polymerase subunit RPC12/RpoP